MDFIMWAMSPSLCITKPITIKIGLYRIYEFWMEKRKKKGLFIVRMWGNLGYDDDKFGLVKDFKQCSLYRTQSSCINKSDDEKFHPVNLLISLSRITLHRSTLT